MRRLVVTLVLGVPAAYALHGAADAGTRVEEIIVLPLAIPGLAIALALIITYGGFADFRASWLFILVGHVLFTLPFMVRSVMAILCRDRPEDTGRRRRLARRRPCGASST